MATKGITLTYDISKEQQMMASYNRRMRTLLERAGMAGVNHARDNHSYLDQTGNLTSSIGCVVSDDGQQTFISDFEQKKEGADGQTKGKAEAQQSPVAAANHIRLDVVAGMEYASFVEAGGANRRPHDVVTFAQSVVEEEITKGIEALFGK